MPQKPSTSVQSARRRARGFTIVELVIAILVVGVLMAVALPNFLDSIRKGRRSEAMTALSAVQQAQERYRSNNASYASTLTTLGVAGSTRPGGHYTLTLTGATASGYTVTADGSAGSQARDSSCAKLSVQVDRGQISYASCSDCSTFTYAASDRCFAQ